MKVSELWLREWVNPNLSTEQLCAQMTMAGLEVEDVIPVAEEFTGIVVGKILEVTPHPEADRLNLCVVDVGGDKPLAIVCGAKNVKVGMKVPTALVGAKLPNKKEIIKTDIRGITSYGMLCSMTEIGLSEQGEGLMQLPANAPLGQPIWDYLKLTDHVIDVSITPNRGDCLGVLGLSKEISAITHSSVHVPHFRDIKATTDKTLPVKVINTLDCPHYVGRVITEVKADAMTPMWMQERLRRSGIRCISPVVDVMNYVMLELGQPMHAFDLDTLSKQIEVRSAKKSEELTLLDGQTVKILPDTLLIADTAKPLALAGVMGGLDSGVTLLTKNIFLESAYFNPKTIAKTAQIYNLSSDSSYRFVRSVDPTLQKIAIERATELLLEIVGGQPGPIIEVTDEKNLPKPVQITLRKKRLTRVLGITIPDKAAEKILTYLGLAFEANDEGWVVTVPTRRADLTLEIDLIEEMIRLYGFDKLPALEAKPALTLHPRPETILPIHTIRSVLRDQGFNEVITYSFVDEKLQTLFDKTPKAKALLNPISAEMSVMRTSLWPGLLMTLLYNQNRQQNRLRLFEVGLRFIPTDTGVEQQRMISGLISGPAYPEQWGLPERAVDFFDLKGYLENIFKCTYYVKMFNFKPSQHLALHPGQTAEIWHQGRYVGIMGALHPSIQQELDITSKVFLFELHLDELEKSYLPQFVEISKFPEIRRDLAILVDNSVPVGRIQDTIKEVVGDLLREVRVFDVYQGKGILPHQKSIALSLILQHATRTLRDEEVAEIMERVIMALKDQFTAELRS